jgi:hypothetical protein
VSNPHGIESSHSFKVLFMYSCRCSHAATNRPAKKDISLALKLVRRNFILVANDDIMQGYIDIFCEIIHCDIL